MSRVSRKSELSPSVTRGGSGIDLGKNSGVDMGQKSQPSITSGGIGVTQEITNVGGATVSAGIEIDVTPVDFGINVDPSEGTISVSGGAEVPGGLIGVSGGIEVDLNTGEITGGSIGGEIGGLGINLSNSKKGGLGIEFTVQIPGTPIELSLGFGFPPKKEYPTPTPTPTPTPNTPGTDNPNLTQPPILFPDPEYPTPEPGRSCSVYFGNNNLEWENRFAGGVSKRVRTSSGSYSAGIAVASLTGEYVVKRKPSGEIIENRDLSYPATICRSISTRYFATYGVSISYFEGTDNILVSGLEENIYNVARMLNQGITTTNYIVQNKRIILSSTCNPESNPPPSNPPSPSPSPSPSPFPNPPPRRQNKMDACCRENLKFLRAIYTGLGIAKFPGKLPATIIQEVSKEGEAPAEPPQVPIADFVDLLDWQFRRDDERWGQWEIQINVKDGDLTKEGDQGKSIKFPNLAESIAEIEGQMLSVMANVDALVAITTKNLVESGMARQEAIKGYLASMAIAKYMAFPYEEIDVEIPSTYTPGAVSIDKLIIESIIHTKGIDYTNKETLRDSLLDLLQAAAIIRGVHWRQVDPKNNVKKQILSVLKGSVELSEKITNVKAASVNDETEQSSKESWEDKLDQYENGFGFATGIENANTPYGRDRERRPRIRQIGDNIAQAGKNE